jgi:uncharacterized membrane protein YuzA (DUF378 family)
MNASTVLNPLQANRKTPDGTKILATFVAITFGLIWGLAALGMLFYDQVTAIFGEIGPSNPLVILAVYSPGIAGVFFVWRYEGLKGLGSFFRRLMEWRMPLMWWLFLSGPMPNPMTTCCSSLLP